MTASVRWLSKRRLHLQHGPIDLIVEAEGADAANAYSAAERRFASVLEELVSELPVLRSDTCKQGSQLHGSVANRMVKSARLFIDKFTTPMIAVAGSVADEILSAMCSNNSLNRACVNNGGDIALYLNDGHRYKAGIVSNPHTAEVVATAEISAADKIGGIATSGRHGRSLSLGIADAVTVMAASASMADAAATLIANEVNLPANTAIQRLPANVVDPDSDLNDQLVTVEVGALTPTEICSALDNALSYACSLRDKNLINTAYLTLRGEVRTVTSLHPEPGKLLYA